MADVFISYHEDSAGTLAQQIAATLESWGITCWVARRNMPDGGDFAGEIPKQINACKLFLLLLNKGACQSLYVPNELALAFQRSRDIHILPLKIGEFQEPDWVSFFLVLIQWIPFPAQPDAQELHRLAARVAQLLNRRPTPPQPAKAPIASKVKSMSEKLAPLSVLSLGQKVKKALSNQPPQKPPSPNPDPPKPQIIDSGECGDNVDYTLYENGLLIISGSGPMRDYYLGKTSAPWIPKSKMIFDMRIQKGVTYIGAFTFYNCENLTSVHIPDSVTSMGPLAFAHCANLTSVRIPDSVMSIEYGAFGGCKKLQNASVPANADIEVDAFELYTKVTTRHAVKSLDTSALIR